MSASKIKKAAFLYYLIVLSVLLSGCGVAAPDAPSPAAPKDLLAKVLARGTLVVATDSNYPPQSKSVEGEKRAADTKCASNESTANEFIGFDIATAVEIARRLGVEACFVTPEWSQLIAGSWDSRWDISIGSMTITDERLKVLYFSQPYYSTPAAVFVHKDNKTFSKPADLSGKRIGTCTGCAYEDYLRGKLTMPANPVEFVIKDPQIVSYQVDLPALEDLAAGDGVNLDAAITSQTTGLQAIKDGMPIRQLGDPLFFEFLAAAMDKSSNQDSKSLAVRVTEIIQQMHADGTLLKLSNQYYGMDATTVAGKFDVKALGQLP
jgi:polar amino acid transport system substrate-binding protein